MGIQQGPGSKEILLNMQSNIWLPWWDLKCDTELEEKSVNSSRFRYEKPMEVVTHKDLIQM